MSGKAYLSDIKQELTAGRRQHRMGENVLAAFGFVRRRESSLAEINKVMSQLGLVAEPPIDAQMPLRIPRIRFRLADGDPGFVSAVTATEGGAAAAPVTSEEVEKENVATVEVLKEQLANKQPALIEFRVSNLPFAEKVKRIGQDETVKTAYTLMRKNKYSQLVVASKDEPRYSDVKGLVSDRSITDAYMKGGSPHYVRECMEDKPPQVRLKEDDVESVINQLSKHDVVLVTAEGDKVVGIMTAWDLQNQFASLAVPFSLVAEIESRLRIAVSRIGMPAIRKHLGAEEDDAYASISDFTLGELTRVLQNPDFWSQLDIPNYARKVFVEAIDEAREFRNRLMHFREPDSIDVPQLRNICDLLRGMPI